MKYKILFLLLVSSVVILKAQSSYTDKKTGFSVKIPEGWTKETPDVGELALRVSNPDGTAFFDVNLRKLGEATSAKEYVEYLEGFMPDAGYSENTMDPQKREYEGDDARYYFADDIYGGQYTKDKNGIQVVQVIWVYRRGVDVYMTVETYTKEKEADLLPAFDILRNSFKLAK